MATSRRLYINAATGTMLIGNANIDVTGASANPLTYRDQLYFHAGLPYLQIRQSIYCGNITFPAQARGQITWDDGSKGCGKIICTKLHELGYLPHNIYEADQRFGEYLRATDPYAYHGYIKWASIVVDWIEKGDNSPQFMFWIRDAEKRKTAQSNLVLSWSRKIATPWAEHMAFRMGALTKDNSAGSRIMKFGLGLSRLVGKHRKSTKPNTSLGLGYALWLVFGVFWLLAGSK